jgi:hypothetical protein
MDIHKPKPWHGLREFTKEYLIIVAGVLTALAGEQAVETVHRTREVAEARRALQDEIGTDWNALNAQVRQSECGVQRLDELSRWQQSLGSGEPIKLTRPAVSPTYMSLRTNVWRVATSAGVAQMSFELRVAYGQLYDSLAEQEAIRDDMRHRWEDVAQASAAQALTQEEVTRLRGDLVQIRQDYALFNHNSVEFGKIARGLGLKPAPTGEIGLPSLLQPVCRSLLTS